MSTDPTRHSRRQFTLLLGCTIAVGAREAAAQQAQPVALQEYDVELIIFRTLSASATPEQWSMEAAAAGQRLTIPEDEQMPSGTSSEPAAFAPENFPSLPAARFKLNPIEDTLRRSRNYQPIAHIGWTQPGFPRNSVRYLSVNSLVSPSTGLVGQIALSRGRYLHLTLDLVLDAPGASGEPSQRFVLRQTRRMRSNERHYIDHPRFGVIALVGPAGQA